MALPLRLNEMTTKEKLDAMELLWQDLAGSVEPLESPDWHKEILDKRQRRATGGDAEFLDWEAAKTEIRKVCES